MFQNLLLNMHPLAAQAIRRHESCTVSDSKTSTEWSRRTTWWGGFSKKVLPLIAKEVDFLRSNLPFKKIGGYTTENAKKQNNKKLAWTLYL